MSDEYARVQTAAAFVRECIPAAPGIAIVLGSGLGDFASQAADPVVLPYESLPGWPRATVIGHAGELVVGTIRGRTVAVLSGRAHFYEGHPMANVVFATRVMGALGVKTLLLTNAAGGINTSFSRGVLMAIDDHINLVGTNPLIGPNDERFGPRFPDMTEVYSKRLREVADSRPRGTAFRSPMASTSACTGRVTKRRPRSGFSARLAPTPSGCPRWQRPSRRATWAWRCSASRASPTWRPACCRSRSTTPK